MEHLHTLNLTALERNETFSGSQEFSGPILTIFMTILSVKVRRPITARLSPDSVLNPDVLFICDGCMQERTVCTASCV